MAKAGFSCHLTVGGTPSTVGTAQDVDLSMSGKEIEVTARSSGGWKEYIQGLKEADLTIGTLWVPTDTAYAALQAAFIAGTVMAFSYLDASTAGKGFSGNMIVTEIGPKQPLNGTVTCSIKCKVTGALTPV
jgi:predicted secreted protein